MLCGTFKKKRRHPGDEYRLVRSNTMPRVVSGARDASLVPIRRTKSSRAAARPLLIKDLLHMVSMTNKTVTKKSRRYTVDRLLYANLWSKVLDKHKTIQF